MSDKYTIKSQLALDIFTILFTLLVAVCEVYFKSEYSDLVVSFWFIIIVILLMFQSKFKGLNDELSENILAKTNKKCMGYTLICITFIGMASAGRKTSHLFNSPGSVGVLILSSILLIAILRLYLFIYYEKEGIYN